MQIIKGLPGSGKTKHLLDDIESKVDSAWSFYLVPEQFSLQSELLLLRNKSAATQVQVLSFNRLAYRLLTLLGKTCGEIMDDLGKHMLLNKIMMENEEKLQYYRSCANKYGFLQELSHTVTEMIQYRITTEDLLTRIAVSTKGLQSKITDTALLYTKFRERVNDKYLLSDDTLEILVRKLEENADKPIPFLDGAFFWIDGFSGFTPVERQILKHIIKRADTVKFAITLADKISVSPRETVTNLEDSAVGAVEIGETLEENFRHVNAPGLAFLVKNFASAATKNFASGATKYTDNIEIYSAKDVYNEVYMSALLIQSWVKTCRYRDIAILCGDRLRFEKILQTVFARVGIPIFIDSEVSIYSHPLTELVRSVVETRLSNMSHESVFRFLKTGLTPLAPDMIDVLENFVLAFGIKSFRWNKEFHIQAAEIGRTALLEMLKPLTKYKADTKTTVREFTRSIFDLLYGMKIPEKLQELIDEGLEAGDPAAARVHGQIWAKLCEVFDKLVEILGEERVTLKTYAAMLDTGLRQVSLGRIPPATDQVILGDINRSRFPEIKYMIVSGANEGSFPKTPVRTGLFTDRERRLLKNSGLEFAPDNKTMTADNLYNIYCAISQPREKLVFLFSSEEIGGKPLRIAPVLKKIMAMFPENKVQEVPHISEYEKLTKPEKTAELSPEIMKSVMPGDISTSATRLECYARCPFSYFMTYMLLAKPRSIYEVLPGDTGNLFHDVIAGFTKTMRENADTITREEINRLIEGLVVLPEDAVFYSTARNKQVIERVKRIAAASCYALCSHLKVGTFSPELWEYGVESKLTTEDGRRLSLSGRVDRIDIAKNGDENFVKIIDYKSGNTKFDLFEAESGVQLQLPLYMSAVTRSLKQAAKPGGLFYFNIADPLLDTDVILDDAILETELLKTYKMSGLVSESALTLMDRGLSPGGSSSVIPVQLTKEGRAYKSEKPIAVSDDVFSEILQNAENKAVSLISELASGIIAAKPFGNKQRSACDFCVYDSTCGKI